MPNLSAIEQLLPHRDPFLMIDRIVELEKGKRAVCIKEISGNEEFFKGHFPDEPIMPGVLILEAMAQTGGIAILSMPTHQGKIGYLASIERVRFRLPSGPGDQILIEATIENIRAHICYIQAKASVNDQIICDARFAMVLKAPEVNEPRYDGTTDNP